MFEYSVKPCLAVRMLEHKVHPWPLTLTGGVRVTAAGFEDVDTYQPNCKGPLGKHDVEYTLRGVGWTQQGGMR